MTTTSPAPGTAIMLNREELLIISQLLNIEDIPGFDRSWIIPDTEASEEMRNRMKAAAEGLIRFGYVEVEKQGADDQQETTLRLSPEVASLLETCINREKSLQLTQQFPDNSDQVYQIYIHEFQGRLVASSRTRVDIYQFKALDGLQEMLTLLDEALALPEQEQPDRSLPAGTIRTETLIKARDLLQQKGAEEITRLLTEEGLPEPTARTLQQSLQEASAIARMIIAWRDDQGETHNARLGVIIRPELCLAIEYPQDGEAQDLTVRQIAAAEVRRWIIRTWQDHPARQE